MTVLFVTTIMPGGRRTGSEVASAAFVDAMRAAGHRVVVLGYRRAGTDPPRHEDDVVAADRRIETRAAGLHPLGWMAGALVRRLPYSVAKYRSAAYRGALGGQLAGAAAVVVDHAQMAWAVPSEGFGRPWAYLAHNVEHQLYAQAGGRARGPAGWANRREARCIEAVERGLVRDAGGVWALSADDARGLDELGAARPPRRFDLAPAAGDESEPDGEPVWDVGLLGTWTWDANAAGLRWFLSQVRGRLPESARVAVAGAGARVDGAGVESLGVVPDAAAFLRSARVVAVPSVAGSGVQVKTLDAIANGVPVVATRVALRGIPDPPPTVRVADRPEDFARALAEALASGPDDAAAATARAWARERRARFQADVAEAVRELEAA
jgi:glycosyltransferase involved in cell wall biosynthesis